MKKALPQVQLTWSERFTILRPYFTDRFSDQLKNIWLIITYLIFFQVLVLGLPLVDAGMIGLGILVVLVGLVFFMEGLTLGLMPFGESIGASLPQKAGLPVILGFSFLLGLGATFAEPAIATLQMAGRFLDPEATPLLYSLLNEFAGELVLAVGVGVGIAVIFGVLRFLYSWSLKILVFPLVLVLSGLTYYFHNNQVLQPVIGLAWDCGAVTTGPVTVPLVLALGIGVSRIVSGDAGGGSGFGIVTLASLFPILAVMGLALGHYHKDDYYGRPHSLVEISHSTQDGGAKDPPETTRESERHARFTQEEFEAFQKSGQIPPNAEIHYTGTPQFIGGKITIEDPILTIFKKENFRSRMEGLRIWDQDLDLGAKAGLAGMGAIRAILPLCLFLFLVMRLVLKEPIHGAGEIFVGILFSLVGMALFTLGIYMALDPLGSQVGQNISASFASILPYGMKGLHGPLFESGALGQAVVIFFSFVLGYSATLAEPALNALGATVEKITIGSFRKSLLIQSVAIGVGLGIALGVAKLVFHLPLGYYLIVPYLFLLILTFLSEEDFVNFAWDSAGVTTGPITVPLVLAMGLGIGSSVSALEGFGVLAMASVFPIVTVLAVGLVVKYSGSDTTQAREED